MDLPGIPPLVTKARGVTDRSRRHWLRVAVLWLPVAVALWLWGDQLGIDDDVLGHVFFFALLVYPMLAWATNPVSSEQYTDATSVIAAWAKHREAWAAAAIESAEPAEEARAWAEAEPELGRLAGRAEEEQRREEQRRAAHASRQRE